MSTATTKPPEVQSSLRVNSKVWIASVWHKSRAPMRVTITRIWKRQHFHFKPSVHGDSFFGPNGMCFSKYQSAYRTEQEAKDAR